MIYIYWEILIYLDHPYSFVCNYMYRRPYHSRARTTYTSSTMISCCDFCCCCEDWVAHCLALCVVLWFLFVVLRIELLIVQLCVCCCVFCCCCGEWVAPLKQQTKTTTPHTKLNNEQLNPHNNNKNHNTTQKAKGWITQSSQQQQKHNSTHNAERWATQSSQQQKTKHHTQS
jgi:hypothetical protein